MSAKSCCISTSFELIKRFLKTCSSVVRHGEVIMIRVWFWIAEYKSETFLNPDTLLSVLIKFFSDQLFTFTKYIFSINDCVRKKNNVAFSKAGTFYFKKLKQKLMKIFLKKATNYQYFVSEQAIKI